MSKTRSWIFRIAAVALLVAIAGAMMVIGRGHTVYFDNYSLEYNGQTYETPYKITVIVKDEQIAKLYDKERGMSTWIGQSFEMDLEVMQEKGGSEETVHIQLDLPYSIDGIIVNLPAVLAGLPEEAYLTEFVPAAPEPEPEDENPEGLGEDDLGLDDFDM